MAASAGPSTSATDSAGFAEALSRAKSGDAQGFVWLHQRYGPAVASVVQTAACPHPDLTANRVLTQAFDGIGRFVGDHGDFCAHLYLLCRFRLVDQARARSRTAGSSTDDAGASQPETERALSVAQKAMEVLSASQREVMALRVFFGLNAPEVAHALDMSLDEVLTVQQRARGRLLR